MELLNAAVAAFAHRAISERNPDVLASEALAYIAAGLQAERVELYALGADGETLELVKCFPTPLHAPSVSLPARGGSVAAEAYARRGTVVRDLPEPGGQAYGAATAVECDDRICVFAAYSRERPFADAARTGIDAIAAMYAAAMARSVAEEQLARRERQVRLIVDQIPAVISTFDTDLVFTSVQGAVVAEVAPDVISSVIGQKLETIVEGGEDSLPVVCARKALAGTPVRYEWTWQGRNYENRMEPLRDADGRIVGAVNLGVDITEKRQAETALRDSREELRRLSAAMHQSQENQRRRIAREIHDDLGQRLTALRLDVGMLRTELLAGRTSAAEERTAAMLALIDETVTTARRVAMELRPAILDDFGFTAAIEQEVESFARRTGMQVALEMQPEGLTLEPAHATALYRVIQEALTNVARHSGASRVDIRVQKKEGRIEAEVRDNGRGISDEELRNPAAFGLIGIRERIFAFDGTAVIERVDGGGTRVFVSVSDEDPDRR